VVEDLRYQFVWEGMKAKTVYMSTNQNTDITICHAPHIVQNKIVNVRKACTFLVEPKMMYIL